MINVHVCVCVCVSCVRYTVAHTRTDSVNMSTGRCFYHERFLSGLHQGPQCCQGETHPINIAMLRIAMPPGKLSEPPRLVFYCCWRILSLSLRFALKATIGFALFTPPWNTSVKSEFSVCGSQRHPIGEGGVWWAWISALRDSTGNIFICLFT